MKRFWDKVIKSDGCWLWAGAVGSKGYGLFKFNGLQARAHRVSWELVNGPTELFVLHECDTPLCVRPDHLFLGTHQDNQADKIAKGRQARGATHGMSKLTRDQVLDARARFLRGESKLSIARTLGVSDVLIGKVLYKHWTDFEGIRS